MNVCKIKKLKTLLEMCFKHFRNLLHANTAR